MYGMRSKGRRMSKRHSRKQFSSVAQWIHPINVHQAPMRGGFRL